jgi:hypothetical protein
MGGKSSVFNKPLGSTGDNVLGKNNFFTNAANLGVSAAMGNLSLNKNNPLNLENTMRNLREGFGEISGTNALRKQAMDQQQALEEKAIREANASDAAARNAGGDATNVFLASGKRGKKGGSGSGTGSGTGSSKGTGVQS